MLFPLQIVRGFCNGRSVLLDFVTFSCAFELVGH